MTRLDDMTIPYQEPSRLDGSIDELFSQLESEILGTLYYLRNGSDSAALAAFDSLRARCEKYAQSGEVDNFRVLVFRIIYNEANSQRKTDWMKLKRRRSNSSVSLEPVSEEDQERKLEQQVCDVVLQTSFDDRAVFLLRQNGELTYDQISKTVGESVEVVQTRMRRTLTSIISVLAPTSSDARASLHFLLYGLLDEEAAEEARSSVAADGAVAKLYDEALANREIIKRAAKRDDLVLEQRDATTRSVPVEPTRFETTTPAVAPNGALIDGETAPTSEDGAFSEKEKAASNLVAPNSDDAGARAQAKKNRKRAKKNASSLPLTANELQQSGRNNVFQRVNRTLATRWQKATRYLAKTSVVTRVLVALLLLFVLTASSALLLQSSQLRRLLRDEFRVQAALPSALVRGEFQQIVVCTSDVNGKPKRTPVRFCFSDPKTRDFIIAHTESGNIDGYASYDLPDLTDFPDEVCLSVFAGSDEVEAFQTFLPVKVGDSRKNQAQNAWARVSGTNELFPDVSPLWTNVFDKLANELASAERDDDSTDETLESEEGEPVSDASESDAAPDGGANETTDETFTLYLFPEIGRFASNFTNKTRVLCLDSKGRPQEGQRFFLREDGSETPMFWATDSSGVAVLDWNIKKDASYQLGRASDVGEEATNADDAPAEGEEAPLTDASENPFQPEVVATDSYASVCFNASDFQSLPSFIPPSNEQTATFSVSKRTLDFDDPLSFSVTSDEKTSFVMALEKSGVIVGERLLTSRDAQKQFEIKLPEGLVGLFKVSFYSYANPFRFEKLGETTLFRRYSGNSTLFAASVETDVETSASDESEVDRETLVVKTSNPNLEKTRSKQRKWNELPMTLDVLWAPDFPTAVASLELDELYGSLDDETLENVLATSRASNNYNPPVLIDNLSNLKTRVRDKLERYQSHEAGASLWIVRLGFWGCVIIAAIAVYLNVFGVFTTLKGLGVLICAGLCASFLWGGQRSLSQSFEATTDIVTLIEDDRDGLVARSTKPASPPLTTARNGAAPDLESNERPNVLSASRKIALGTWKASLKELFNTDQSLFPGVVLVKLNDGRSRSWTAIPLEKTDEESPSSPPESEEVALTDVDAN